MRQPHAHPHPRPGHHGPPHESPLPLISLCVCARVSTPRERPNPSLARNATGAAPRCMGRDNHVPPHYRCSRSAVPRTRQQRPHQSVSTQASKPGQRGWRDHTAPATPSKRANTKKAQTPQANTGSSANTKPSHPQANTPTSKPQQGTPPSEHKERPRQSAWASKMCERGNPRALAGATGMKQSRRNPHKGGHAGQAHKERANNGVCADRAALRPPNGG